MALDRDRENSKARPALRDLHRIMDDSFVVQHISVRLECCNSNDDGIATKKRMDEHNFDRMGCRENGVIVGYVLRDELKKGPCLLSRKPLLPGDIIASRAPLNKLLPIMLTRPCLFVLEHTEINGLVTRSDLQKSPVRMLLFGLLSLLEMYLLSMIRICYPPEALGQLSGLDTARELLRIREGRDEETDLADCLTLPEKSTQLIKKSGFAEFFGLGSPKEASGYFKDIESLRNKLAHARDLVKESSWERVILTIINLESFLSKCDNRFKEFETEFGKH